jgi:dienelactone hydrolase
MAIERISYRVGNKHFVGALVYDERVTGKRPLLLVAPNWLGMTDEVIERTRTLAGSRFVGFVADMYGEGKSSAGPPEAAQLADALRGDVKERRARITGALSTLTTESEKRGIGDVARKAAARLLLWWRQRTRTRTDGRGFKSRHLPAWRSRDPGAGEGG